MVPVEVYFDCSSPWTYLAFHRLAPLVEDARVALTWKPILVGGIFNTVNPSVYAARENPVPAKRRYATKDLQDWAAHCGIRIEWPSIFPVNSVKAMRGCLVADAEGRLVPFARAVFEAYWRDDRDISRDDVLADLCDRVSLEREAFFAAIAWPETKQRLKDQTDELMRRGGFGSPTIFVDGDDMYFGNDRLPLIHAAIDRAARRAT